MNRKLIFEAPNLPGGLIFTQVAEPAGKGPLEHRGDEIAKRFNLRFKGSEPTADPVSPLRFAPERFTLNWLIREVVAHRQHWDENELDLAEQALRKPLDARDRARARQRQLNARPNWCPEEMISAADWCKGPHPDDRACSYCGPIIESHLLHKAMGG